MLLYAKAAEIDFTMRSSDGGAAKRFDYVMTPGWDGAYAPARDKVTP
jgi:hypothetical protein